jgi:D-alanyl-D-alanine carboxypeptidase (penicillin-binding protein 5/6)
VPALVQDRLEAEISYESPVRAPVMAGQQIGTLVIDLPDLGPRELPLTAERDVGVGGFLSRMRTAAQVLLRDIAGRASPL